MSESDVSSKSTTLSLSKKLHSAFETAVEKFTSSVKYSSFKKKFKAIHKVDPDGLKNYYDQLVKQLRKNIREDLKNTSTNHGIGNLLDSLQKINKTHNAISWRPSGNPEEDVRDHVYVHKVQHKDSLKNYLFSLQQHNDEIATEVALNHAEILSLKERNEELYKKLSIIIDLYTGSNLQNFEKNTGEFLKELHRDRHSAKHKILDSPKSPKKVRFS